MCRRGFLWPAHHHERKSEKHEKYSTVTLPRILTSVKQTLRIYQGCQRGESTTQKEHGGFALNPESERSQHILEYSLQACFAPKGENVFLAGISSSLCGLPGHGICSLKGEP